MSCSPLIDSEMIVLPLSRSDSPTAVQSQYGKYYTPVAVGTPAVMYNLMVSTLGADLLLAGSNCQPRCDYTPSYSAQNSSTSTQLCESQDVCTFFVNYPQHAASISGNTYADLVSLGTEPFRLPLGAWSTIHNLHIMIPAPMVGVLGLLPTVGPIDSQITGGNTSLLTTLYGQGFISGLSVSLCLGDYGGVLLLGGTDPNLHSGGAAQVASLDPATLGMSATQVSINKVPLSLPQALMPSLNPVVVDTGFLELVVPQGLYDLLSAGMLKYCSASMPGLCANGFFGDNHQCLFLDPPVLKSYPTISLALEGPAGPIQLAIPAAQWLSFVAKKGYCLAILPSALSGIHIGTQVLTAYYTSLNYSASEPSVSFAPSSNCTGAVYTMSLLSGNHQKGPVATAAKLPLMVQILSLATAAPVSGVYVNFQVVVGSASLVDIQPTDANGIAFAQFRYGFGEGVIQIVASVDLAIPANLVFTVQSEKPLAYLVLSALFCFLCIVGTCVIYYISNRHRKHQQLRLVNSPVYELISNQGNRS
ncbi:MAG: pepsin-like aspartic protease [archaeon]|nr:pepsin-like aspartic protease [archaeon]